MTHFKLRVVVAGIALLSLTGVVACADLAGVMDDTLRNICDSVPSSSEPQMPGTPASEFDIEVEKTSPTTQSRLGDPVIRVFRCVVH